ncbi:MAG: CSLREA domain-containing protein, partial [Anaerolineales bacterium]|nr:CSLREA domain-containing protein [Anaerolineales bacterium]
TLREAITAANTNTAVDNCPAGNITTTVISLPAGTYTLTIPGILENDNQTGDLDILSTVVINGAGRDTTIINGNDLDRVFDVRDAGHATMSHLTLTGGGNSGSSGGGARAVFGGTIHLSHAYVTGNSSDGFNGGGLAVMTGTLTIEYTQITQNVATALGGGVYNLNGTTNIRYSAIVGNEAGSSGGGIMNIAGEGDATLTIMDSEVLNNTSGNNGGGISNVFDTGHTATLLVERVWIDGNSAAVGDNGLSGLGGGLTNNVIINAASGAGIVTIRDSVISNNQATNGGGIGNTPATATGPVNVQVTVENSVIWGNTAGGNGVQTGNGGGIASLDGTLTVINSTISGNTAAGTAGAGSVSGLGGAMLIGSQVLPNNVTLVANTIANNTAVTGASGIAHASLGGATTAQFKNNIIAANVGANCVNNGGTMTSLGYNLEDTDSCGFDQATDLVDTDPVLAGLTGDGATYVHPFMDDTSPAIDAGSCTDADDNPLATDQRGVPRPQGSGCDIGAYERVLPTVSIAVDTTADDLTDNGNCTLREAIEAANTKTAVDMCPAGGVTTTITIPAGTYTLAIAGDRENDNQTGDLDILSNVVLVGAGQAETILDGNSLDRLFDVHDPGRAQISHLTITNGSITETSSGGGIRVFEAHADIDHVRFHGNLAGTLDPDFGGGGGGIYFFGSTGSLNQSEVRNNTAFTVGGGVYILYSNVVVSQTLIQDNSSVFSSGGGLYNSASGDNSSVMIVDSQIISNTSAFNGGGVGNVVGTGFTATMHIERTLISNNSTVLADDVSSGAGGGVANGVFIGTITGLADMTIRDSVIRQNTATNGGGISSTPAGAVGLVATALTIENSAIADNTAVGSAPQTGNGGGILALDGSLTLINSTISGNTAAGTAGVQALSGVGGGIVVGSQALPNNTTLVANTIVNNTAVTGASGLANVNVGAGSIVAAKNNILADNVGANCVNQGGTATSLGYNLASDASCTSFDQTTDLTSTDPMLDVLTMDGATYVHPLMAGSPAI